MNNLNSTNDYAMVIKKEDAEVKEEQELTTYEDFLCKNEEIDFKMEDEPSLSVMAPKKVGIKGRTLHSQAREIIDRVAAFMQKEAEEGLQIPLKNYRERILAATGISKNTLLAIRKEGRNVNRNMATTFSTPKKTRQREKKFPQNPTLNYAIKNIIYNFYITEKRSPTVKDILRKIDEQGLDFTGSRETLRKVIISIGFRWKKMQDNRTALIEKHDIRLKRVLFLKKIKQYRDEGRNIVYTDETYIHSSHTQSDQSNKDLKKPMPKGRRLVIVHAGGKTGFIPNGLLIFKSGLKGGDYHNDMSYSSFMRWVETQLLPNLPERSVLVLDNVSYHNVTVEANVTSSSLKQVMIEWLQDKNIAFGENLTKPELYAIIQENKHRFPPTYVLDQLLEKNGHTVLRLPPCHPELNPIEKIWASIKNWVAAHNTTFMLNDVEALTRQRCNELPLIEWTNICRHVEEYEMSQIEREYILDSTLDHLHFTVNTGSSEESWSEEDSDSVG